MTTAVKTAGSTADVATALAARIAGFELESGAILIQVPQVPLELIEPEVAKSRGYFAYPPHALFYLSATFRGLGLETRLLDLNFVFLGYREYDLVEATGGRALVVAPGSGLGILSKEDWSSHHRPTPLAAIPEALRARVEDGELLIYSKTNAMSTVHRRARMDYIGVRRLGPDGTVIGEARMVGLFTSKAYMEPASATPVLAGKLRRILEAEDLFEGSHDYKAATQIFESFPKDELFAAPVNVLTADPHERQGWAPRRFVDGPEPDRDRRVRRPLSCRRCGGATSCVLTASPICSTRRAPTVA